MKLGRNFLFRRAFFVLLALIVQLGVVIGAIFHFRQYYVVFYIITLMISMVAVLWIVNNNSHPAYKVAWIIPILVFPVFGGLFYLFFGGTKLTKRVRKRMSSIENQMRQVLAPQPHILADLAKQNLQAVSQSTYIQNCAYCPPYANTETLYLPSGEESFEKLKEELAKAQHYIFLEYFIIAEGQVWDSILEILKTKVAQGVEVRLIYDDAGCLLTLPYGYDKTLERMGIKCCVFNPLLPLLSPRLNNRDHRKIAIIDGHTGFTGGINLADEYINAYPKYGHWKDSTIMLKGEGVWSLTVMFLSMWNYIRGTDEDFRQFRPHNLPEISGNRGYVQPFIDSPLDDETVGEIVYLNLINKASKYVYITTPYLVVGNEMATALISAAKGGVDIRIITPHIPDKWYVHQVTRSYYKVLLENGVKIYEYTPGFIHSKTFVVDDQYGVVGTINLDFRSLYLHFECGVWLYNCESIKQIKEDFLRTLEVSQQITLADVAGDKWYKTLAGSLLRVFAPLM
jgi:cardiolipin synthase